MYRTARLWEEGKSTNREYELSLVFTVHGVYWRISFNRVLLPLINEQTHAFDSVLDCRYFYLPTYLLFLHSWFTMYYCGTRKVESTFDL